MRILGSIVEAFVLAVLHTRQQRLFGCSIARQFIGDQYTRDILTAFQELAKELLRSCFIPSALNQNIENIAILVDRSPEIVQSAIDFEEDFIKMPFVTCLRPASA